MAKHNLLISSNDSEFLKKISNQLQESAKSVLELRPVFTVGLSGGSCVKYVTSVLKDIDISKWVFFFCDERVVPEDSPDSTYGAYIKAFQAAGIQVSSDQFVKIKQGVSAAEAALDYQSKIAQYYPNDPKFDVLILGMGPDGHTCSLFPGHPLLNSTEIVAAITDSPKPPSDRVTLTLPVLNAANKIIFTVAGAEKADVLEKILIKGDKTFPAGLVSGNVIWILDNKAAAKLL